MSHPRLNLIVSAVLMGAIAACSGNAPSRDLSAPTPASPTPTETTTTPTTPTEAVNRVVALTSLTADIVHTLAPEKLVGIPGSSILRESDRFGKIAIVSEGRVEPDLEKILALQPDWVIGAAGFHDKTLARLQELGIPTQTVEVNSWDNLRSLTTDLATRLGADPQPLLERYEACLAKAPQTDASALVLVSRQPLLSPNKNSWAGDLLTQFNVQNVTADLQGQSPFDGYVTLSAEKVLEANPEMLLVVETGDNLLAQLQKDAFWGQLKATQAGKVYSFDYYGLVNPGSLNSIETTCEQLAKL